MDSLRAVFRYAVVCCVLAVMQAKAAPAGSWATNFATPVIGPGAIRCMAAHGNKVVVIGEFNTAGSVKATNCAAWNGSNWVALPGFSPYSPRGIAVWRNKYYVLTWDRARDTHLLAEWNGQRWSEIRAGQFLGSHLVANDRGIYLADVYTNISEFQGAVTVQHWNGTNWTWLGSRFFTTFVDGAFATGSDLYLASELSEGTLISRWNGTNWLDYPVLPGTYRSVLAMFNGQLHVGTQFGGPPESPRQIVRWEGQWVTLPALDYNGAIMAMVGSTNGLYVAGLFDPSASANSLNVARWDGTRWTILPWNTSDYPMCMEWAGDQLYIGGWFSRLGNKACRGIARWNGTGWAPLQDGVRGEGVVYALAGGGKNLFVGGGFEGFHGAAATNLARWNGTEWKSFGSPNGHVNALCASTSLVFAAGDFTQIGGVGATNAARWNGTNWSALGTGPKFTVHALALWRGELYAGGRTDRPGVQPVSRWTGTTWQAVHGTTNDVQTTVVSRLAGTANALYAIHRTAERGLFRWDGTNWSGVPGSPYYVWEICTEGNDIWVAGSFENYGEALGRWNGSNWWFSTPLYAPGGRLIGGMSTLNGDVYSGQFGTNYVWNGLDWNPLALSGDVYVLSAFSNSVYFGGSVRSAGGKPSYGVAAWQPAAAHPELVARRTADGVLVAWPNALTNYVIESARDVGHWSNAVETAVSVGSYRMITNRAGVEERRLFRLRRWQQ